MAKKEKVAEALGDIASLAKRRGFIFQSSEIYGGLGSCWDYGPLGIELKNNVKNSWWKEMTYREDIEGLEASILMHPTVWKASGHVDSFSDPLVDCKSCKGRFRADQISLNDPCPECGAKDSYTDIRQFNLMFKTFMGPLESDSSVVYLRPETAQGAYVNFLNVQGSLRKKLPFGIAQIGKVFRNEITTGNFIFRTREFEQMEMQYFVTPGKQKGYYEEWQERRLNWHLNNGIRRENLRFSPHGEGSLAHYADMATDIEYKYPIGWSELEGIHSRTDFDLKRHQEFSGKNLMYVDQQDGNKKYLPYVVETAVGLDRTVLSLMCDAYNVENPGDKENERTVLRFKPHMAPIKAAVLPLMKKPEITEFSQKLFQDIQKSVKAEYDYAGSIGKRYRRQDEIGTPFCFTVDFDSLSDQNVTVRDRDTMTQERISVAKVEEYIKNRL